MIDQHHLEPDLRAGFKLILDDGRMVEATVENSWLVWARRPSGHEVKVRM